MKTICFNLIFFLVTVCTQAQFYPKPAIITTDSLVKGIYLDFGQFQRNNPSVRVDFCSNEPSQPLNSLYNNMLVSRLNISDGHGGFMEFTQRHWGICDGKQVFINYRGKYQKISLDGKYCQFTAKLNGFSLDNPSYFVDFMMDITNNDIIEVTAAAVEEILKKENAGLYNEFRKDKNKKMMKYTYITRLNEILNNQ
jgi:hypothetical protein